jgi:hypothetical protein
MSASATSAQLSPGPLSRSHVDLEGMRNCLKCHGPGSGAMNEHCLECHQAVDWLVGRGRGLHGRLGDRECASCHAEHLGLDFALIQWEPGEPAQFDHQRAGWPLDGRHGIVKCKECHKPEFQKSPAPAPKRSSRAESWLGLEPSCLSCHEDHHRTALGPDCARCHDQQAWKPAPNFDHARTSYPLTGKHTAVQCDKCHLAQRLELERDSRGRKIPRYKPLEVGECSACHEDPHRGQLGAGCAKCHVTDGFQIVDSRRFDHDRTRYPLRGAHARLECRQCHDPRTAWGKKPEFARCDSCHRDEHAGKATLAGRVVDCEACHEVAGFRPSTYTSEQHAASAYPLEGKHSAVKCDACHVKRPAGVMPSTLGPAGVLLRPTHERCLSCHEDAHGGQLARSEGGGACEPCHTVQGFAPSSYTARQHAELEMALNGRHLEIVCKNCHGTKRKGLPAFADAATLGNGKTKFALETRCVSCHFDPHDGRLDASANPSDRDPCERCHDAVSFRPSTVDIAAHALYRFPLDGGHRSVPCNTCHEELDTARAGSTLLLGRVIQVSLPFEDKHELCTDCHENPHGDQFAARDGGGACDTCHSADGWRPAARFDHDRDATFSLRGAHSSVACAECHATRVATGGDAMVVYRPTPQRCEDCHAKVPQQEIESR